MTKSDQRVAEMASAVLARLADRLDYRAACYPRDVQYFVVSPSRQSEADS